MTLLLLGLGIMALGAWKRRVGVVALGVVILLMTLIVIGLTLQTGGASGPVP